MCVAPFSIGTAPVCCKVEAASCVFYHLVVCEDSHDAYTRLSSSELLTLDDLSLSAWEDKCSTVPPRAIASVGIPST